MPFGIELILFGATLFGLICLGLEGGRRVAMRLRSTERDASRQSTAVIETAVFGLLGLLVAFTFNNAASRFEARRSLIVREANAIGTAYLRLDLLPEAPRDRLRTLVKEFLEIRVSIYGTVIGKRESPGGVDPFERSRAEIWRILIETRGAPEPSSVTLLLAPALNEMFDATSAQMASDSMHLPLMILVLLCGMVIFSSVLAGYTLARPGGRDWMHLSIFAGVLTLTVMVTLDLEFPTMGLIRLTASEAPLVDLLKSLK